MLPELCKLCREPGELRSSHILPEFVFKPLYDEKHGAVEYSISTGSSRVIRKGYRERLLCGRCEGKFSALESYFADAWIARSPFPTELHGSEHQVVGLNYSRFKLFHLSVLWRAGVSSREEFRLIKLGPYEEKLRQKLLKEDPGPANEFAILVTVLVNPKTRKVERGIYLEPELNRVRDRHFGIFTFAGCGWYNAVHSSIPEDFRIGALRENGSILADVQSITDYKPLTNMFVRLQRKKKRLAE